MALHPKNNTFPGEVFLELATDMLEVADAARNDPIPYESLYETHLPECEFRDSDNGRIQYAILTSAQLFQHCLVEQLADRSGVTLT